MKIGLIGLPNSGKTTLFNALTANNAKTENYPFTTIEPNKGMVHIPDKRIPLINSIVNKKQVIYPYIEFIDIAGLVKNAHKGEGLGNQFLNNIRSVDVVAHVLRFFNSENVPHPLGSIDPMRDLEIIETELLLSDLEIVMRNIEKKEKLVKHDKTLKTTFEHLTKAAELLNNGTALHNTSLSQEEESTLREYGLLTMKPVLYVCSIDESLLSDIKTQQNKLTLSENTPLLFIAAKWESELNELDTESRILFMNEYNLTTSGLETLITIGYETLGYCTFYTIEGKELRGWTIPQHTNAVHAAGKIHSDMEKGFIRADVISYKDFLAYKDLNILKSEGKVKSEGKDYKVQNGDIIKFYFNTH